MQIIAILILLGAAIVAERAIFGKNVLKNLTYTARFSVHEAMEGDVIEIVEEIINDKWLPVPWVKTELSTSRWLEFTGTSAARASDTRFVPSVFSLRPRQKCTRTRRIKALKRGTFSLSSVSIVGSDLLGLVSVSRGLSIDETVRILPAPYETAVGDMSEKELYGEIVARRFICEDPFLISGAREYTGTEPMNRIHWNSTARTGSLMVYNNERSTVNRACVILNMQKSPRGEPHPIVTGDLETYIKAAAFILDMLCGRQTDCDLCLNGSKSGGVYVRGGDDREDYMRLLRALSDAQLKCDSDISDFIARLPLEDRTDIFIITAFIDERLLNFAARQRRAGRSVIFYCNDDSAAESGILRVGRVNRYYFMND